MKLKSASVDQRGWQLYVSVGVGNIWRMESDAISDVGKALQQIAHYLHRNTLGLKFDPDGKYWNILKWILDLYFQPCNLEPEVPNTSSSVDWSIAKGVK